MTEGASECVYAAHYTYGHNGGDDDDERHDDEADRANSSSNWSGAAEVYLSRSLNTIPGHLSLRLSHINPERGPRSATTGQPDCPPRVPSVPWIGPVMHRNCCEGDKL